ncbi:hypothetical protein HXX02_02665 [Microbulbifer elongatus]|uniref:Secreted protein n=1 Tax=Microbulbifer elongatus TaxID=86173 RepID=A0ABT1NWS6_9GAMM|nr:hypothetical protein [Microbulbifer elongatus]MCQ3828339.1 hypothetical protein [Microbulbifer elongatus]
MTAQVFSQTSGLAGSFIRVAGFTSILSAICLSESVLAQQSYTSNNSYPCSNGSEVVAPDRLGDKAIGICGLNSLSEASGDIQQIINSFTIRSCWAWWEGNQYTTAYCEEPRGFSVELYGDTNADGDFVLTGPAGSIPVDIRFRHEPDGSEYRFQANNQSQEFSGAANGAQIPVKIIVTPKSGTFPPGQYEGNFSFALYQCRGTWNGGDCRGADSNGKANLSPPLDFGVRLTSSARIQITGLEDMQLISTGEDIDASQRFCVYTSDGSEFRIKADSQYGSGTFALKSQTSTQTIEYDLRTWALIGPRRRARLDEGVFTRNTWHGHPQKACNAGADENMLLELRIPSDRLQLLDSTSYHDTLTLTVEAE